MCIEFSIRMTAIAAAAACRYIYIIGLFNSLFVGLENTKHWNPSRSRRCKSLVICRLFHVQHNNIILLYCSRCTVRPERAFLYYDIFNYYITHQSNSVGYRRKSVDNAGACRLKISTKKI